MSSQTDSNSTKDIWISFVFALLIGSLFIQKPFTLDDPMLLTVAQHAQTQPLRPYDLMIFNLDDYPVHASRIQSSPLFCWMLAIWTKIGGFGEAWTHIPGIFCLALTAAGATCLARSRNIRPLWIGLATAASPLLLPSTNVMGDVPFAAAAIWTIVLTEKALKTDRKYFFIVASFMAAITFGIKYAGAIIILGTAAQIFFEKSYRWALVFLLPSFLFFLSWSLYSNWAHGSSHFVDAVQNLDHYRSTSAQEFVLEIARNSGSLINILGGAGMFIAAAYASTQNRLRLPALAVGIAAVVHLSLTLDSTMAWPSLLVLIISRAAGGVLLVLIAVTSVRTWKSQIALVSLAIGLPLFIVCIAPMMAVRYVAPAWPAWLLLVAPLFPANSKALKSSVIITMLLGVALSIGDYRFAEFYRDSATRISKKSEGRHVGTIGHWGWQWYAEKNNFVSMTPDDDLDSGDWFVSPSTIYSQPIPNLLKNRLRPINIIEPSISYPISTFARTIDQAGFPVVQPSSPIWTFSTVPWDRIIVWEVD